MFIVVGLVGVLIISSPTIGAFFRFTGEEQFSEFWLSDSNNLSEKFPFNIQTGEENRLFLGVGNHLGNSAYYLIDVKFRNQTQPLPNSTSSKPSSLISIHEFQFILADGDVWETPVNFKILDTSIQDNSMVVENILVNDNIFQVDCPATWDPENNGFYFQLFFELSLYNSEKSTFQFQNQFIGVWLNITG